MVSIWLHSNIFSLLRGSQIAPNSMRKKLIWGWYRNTCLLQTRGTAHLQPRIMYGWLWMYVYIYTVSDGWLFFDLLYKQNTDLAMTPLILGEGPFSREVGSEKVLQPSPSHGCNSITQPALSPNLQGNQLPFLSDFTSNLLKFIQMKQWPQLRLAFPYDQ